MTQGHLKALGMQIKNHSPEPFTTFFFVSGDLRPYLSYYLLSYLLSYHQYHVLLYCLADLLSSYFFFCFLNLLSSCRCFVLVE